MKQRLLLALLMLLTSAGFLKAQINIISTGDAAVKVTLTSDAFTFVPDNYPTIDAEGSDEAVTANPNGKSVVYTIPQGSKKLLIKGAANGWGNISITVDGKVVTFTAAKSDLSNLVKSLSFTNNGKLNKLGVQYLINLTSLSCENNVLSVIPAKTDKMKDYKVGKQTPASVEPISGNAKSFQLKADVFSNILKGLTDGKDLSIETLKDENGNVTTSVKADLVNSVYHFRDAQGIYVDGSFKADIKISNESYPGVVICNVPLSVSPATFGLSLEGYDTTLGNSFKVAVNGTEKTGDIQDLKKGDKITLTPVPNVAKGYEFDKFGTLEGATGPIEEGNGYVFTVVGDKRVKITASFKLKDGVKVTWNTATPNGEIKVYQNGTLLSGNEAALTVGSEIRIWAKANSGVISDVKNGSESLKAEDKDDREDVFDATIKVPVEGANIVVSFATATQKLIIEPSEHLNTVTIKGDDGKDYSKGKNIPVGTKLTITFPLKDASKYISSVLVNGKAYTPEKTAEGTYVMKNYEMPNALVKMIVNVGVLNKVIPTIDNTTPLVYTGDPLPVKYTNADGLTDITVYYGKNGDKVESFKANTPFTDAGTYKVYFYRKADSKYAEIKTEPVEYTIAKAPIVINELPKVSVDEKTKKYQITGGKVGYMKGDQFVEVTDLGGKFVVLDGSGKVVDEDLKEAVVTVRYQVEPAKEYANFTLVSGLDAKVTVEGKKAETIKVSVYKNDYSSLLTMMNGGATIASGSTVPVGSTIIFGLKEKDDNSNVVYSVYLVDAEGEKIIDQNLFAPKYNGSFSTTDEHVKDLSELIFMLDVQNNRTEIKLTEDSQQYLEQKVGNYDGKEHPFETGKLEWIGVKDGEPFDRNADINNSLDIVYTLDGKEVSVPKDAGVYKVTLSRKESTSVKEIKPIEATLIIDKANLTESQVPLPTATRVALGQTLDKSDLSGQVTVEGSYEWNEEMAASSIVVDKDKQYKVKFVPAKNYNEFTFTRTISVPVTTNPIITFNADPEGGVVTVVNKNNPNEVYKSGDEIFAGTELIITATPKNADFELASLKVNGVAVANPYTVKFEKTLEVEATFRPKTTPGNFKVTVPEYLRGTIITGGGEHVVAEGGTLSFTVATASADASKVSVKASNGTVTKGSNGRYTLSGLTANSTVTVSLSNPTALKVDIQKSYLNAGKYHVATVEVESDYTDGKFYYGDEITVVAYPESGVKFEKWSDGSKDQVHDIVLTGDLKLTATFSGTPTGIEDIMAASIATGKGCVWVRGIANADVTIVSIAGRVQARQRISGDTRIDVPAGIYVVVLESGSDVKRVKVIVK